MEGSEKSYYSQTHFWYKGFHHFHFDNRVDKIFSSWTRIMKKEFSISIWSNTVNKSNIRCAPNSELLSNIGALSSDTVRPELFQLINITTLTYLNNKPTIMIMIFYPNIGQNLVITLLCHKWISDISILELINQSRLFFTFNVEVWWTFLFGLLYVQDLVTYFVFSKLLCKMGNFSWTTGIPWTLKIQTAA